MLTGSLLNPAIAFGTQLISLDFSYAIQYILMPLIGGIIGFLSHEFIFMKTQEVFKTTVDLNDDQWDTQSVGATSLYSNTNSVVYNERQSMHQQK